MFYSPKPAITVKRDSDSYKTYGSTMKERTEDFIKTQKESDYGYSPSSRFRPIDKDVTGAKAIRVQDIPNGVVGRPVEFESKH